MAVAINFLTFALVISAFLFSPEKTRAMLSNMQYPLAIYLFFILFIYLFIYLFCFLGLHLQHMEVPRLGVESELQLLATATAQQ